MTTVYLYLLVIFCVVNQINGKCSFTPDLSNHGVRVNCQDSGLDRVPRNFSENTTSLDLRHNKITTIYNGDFESVSNLKTLYLSYNPIHTIQPLAFQGLTSLITLLINGHSLNYSESSLPKHVFIPLKSLNNLEFRSNVSRFGQKMFYPERSLGPLSNLTYLNIDTSPGMVFSDTVSMLGNLQNLSIGKFQIYNCGLNIITNKTFSNFSSCPVLLLDLSDCSFHKFEVGFLHPFPNLKTFLFWNVKLYTNHDLLHVIEALSIYKNKNMSEIKITQLQSRGQISGDVTLSMKILSQICVQTLDLTDCGIGIVDTDILINPFNIPPFTKCVKKWIMRDNNIRGKISNVYFLVLSWIHFEKLEEIDFSMQRIFYIKSSSPALGHPPPEPSEFPLPIPSILPPKLTSVNIAGMPRKIGHLVNIFVLNGRGLRSFNLSFCGLYNFNRTIKGLDNLQVLDFSGNDLSVITETFFDTFPNILTLRLSEAFLDNSFLIANGKRLFSPLHKLKHLDLSNNKLIFLPKDIFDPLTSIQTINLGFNGLISLPDFLNLLNVNSILANYNSLTTLDKTVINMLDKMAVRNKQFGIHLYGNTFSCGCEAYDFILWLNETRVQLDGRNYTCIDTKGELTTTLQVHQRLLIYHRNCVSPIWLSLALGALGLMLSSILTAFVILKNKIKIILFIQQFLGRFIYPKRRCDFLFDAVILYPDSIYQWVCHDMLPELETNRKLKLTIRDRDQPYGLYEPDYILETINNSWKIVLVLCKDFIRTELAFFTMYSCLASMKLTTPNKLILLVDRNFNFPSNIGFFIDAISDDNIIFVDLKDDFTDGFWNKLAEHISCDSSID